MIFNEAIYFAFLVIASAAFRLLPVKVRPWWIFVTGLVFYAYYSSIFLVALIAEMIAVYWLGKRCREQTWQFAVGLALTLGVLGVFKYLGLLGATARGLAAALGSGRVPTFPQLFLPLAISFFTFEFVHYLADARKGQLPEHTFAEFLAFAMFFPTMVAGPIKRFQGFLPQLREAKAGADDLNMGLTRIVVGLFKKVVIADTAGLWTTVLYSNASVRAASTTELVVALVAFSIKIYFDFSGYSDIAIGSAHLFGISVPENFSWPYLRTNIASFWRHWHMSLTSWLTDYVYVPLGGSRRGLPVAIGATLATFLVSGIWHGAAWHFVAWGLYMGVLVAGYRVWRVALKEPLLRRVPALKSGMTGRALSIGGGAVGTVATFALVTVGWGLFVMPVDRFMLMMGRLL